MRARIFATVLIISVTTAAAQERRDPQQLFDSLLKGVQAGSSTPPLNRFSREACCWRAMIPN
jgi:hypothetical protein